jgi:hypothetical protein
VSWSRQCSNLGPFQSQNKSSFTLSAEAWNFNILCLEARHVSTPYSVILCLCKKPSDTCEWVCVPLLSLLYPHCTDLGVANIIVDDGKTCSLSTQILLTVIHIFSLISTPFHYSGHLSVMLKAGLIIYYQELLSYTEICPPIHIPIFCVLLCSLYCGNILLYISDILLPSGHKNQITAPYSTMWQQDKTTALYLTMNIIECFFSVMLCTVFGRILRTVLFRVITQRVVVISY